MATKSKSSTKSKAVAKTEPTTSLNEPADFATDGPPLREVDIADIKPVKDEDSHILLTGESWVQLGEALGVPDWAVGQVAAVISAPIAHKFKDDVHLYDYTPEDALITVRERSQGGTFSVPLDTCTKVAIVGGRSALINFP